MSRLSIKSEDDKTLNRCDELLSALNKKDIECIVFMFEIFFVIIWSKDYVINKSPEDNLVLIIEVDDDYSYREKIFLKLSNEENNKFIPLQKKYQINQVI